MSDFTLNICEPWTMPQLDAADIFIDAVNKQIGSKHVLYGRNVFPVAFRRDPDAVIYETDDDPETYALVYLSWSAIAIKQGTNNNPRTEIFSDRQAIQVRMDMDKAEWLEHFK